MELHAGSHGAGTAIKQGGSLSLELADGSNVAYRYGAAYQATRSCSSLQDCKAVTGGTGFNVAMQIVPSTGGGLSSTESCRVLSCLEDGCDDAYQFPDQDARTHSCSADVEFQVLFCATNSSAMTSDSAADFWVDVGSLGASHSASNSSDGSSDAPEQSGDNAVVEPQSDTSPAPSSNHEKTTTSTGSGGSSGTSTAVYVAAGVAAGVVAVVAAAFVFKRRHAIAFWWETRNYKERQSSDDLGFVRVSDDAVI
ncbi:unnamed protein product [Phytophthora lilii]|uniref:Unnamed protein product n=1 Tax=Phytophthora lilii TaxID=2077276 RepID=A0A9W6TE11_9STRA|nr:unnamed protein product [Phytophthora lilii]